MEDYKIPLRSMEQWPIMNGYRCPLIHWSIVTTLRRTAHNIPIYGGVGI